MFNQLPFAKLDVCGDNFNAKNRLSSFEQKNNQHIKDNVPPSSICLSA